MNSRQPRKLGNGKKVPSSRVSRMARMAGLAGGLAGGMVAERVRRFGQGEAVSVNDVLLTPANAQRLARELATMRGAAMKLGQILSMDTGDFLPRQISDVLARLRADAEPMPQRQLKEILIEHYGSDWQDRLLGFNSHPIAAASIGQVHRAYGPDGEDIVLKIQYPGIAASIDSDVDNMASIFKMSGLLPKGTDISDLLEQTKHQLHDEANYELEAKYLGLYGKNLRDDPRFEVPTLVRSLCRPTILAMSYLQGEPIETLAEQSRTEKNRVMTALIELLFVELFDWRMMQTDPNFANYLYRPGDGKVLLLDFGATRKYSRRFTQQYRELAIAAMAEDTDALEKIATKLGYLTNTMSEEYRAGVLEILLTATEPMRARGPYDFPNSDVPTRLQEIGLALQARREPLHNPPIDALYVHRKMAGLFMLAGRVGASVDVHEQIRTWL